MSKDNQHSEQHADILKKQALEQNEVKEVLNFIKKYALPVVIVVIVVCAYFLVNRYFVSSRLKKEAKADSLLMSAMGPQDLQTIIDDFSSTPSAPIAMMNLAMTKFSDGDYTGAQELYGRFLKKYGKHEMAAQAQLNQIACKEAKGELSEAQAGYADFATKHAASYLAPVALVGHARCLESLGDAAAAKQVYEDLIVSYPGSSWAGLAETRMMVLNSKLK